MASSNLKWVYGLTHRAQDVSNEAVDEYKSVIRQLYLDQNMTRDEVLSHLQDVHGFSLSTNQFSKATKRWGFYKQPRQAQKRMRLPKSIAEEKQAPNPLNPLDELFDFEPDILDTIDETESCSETGSQNFTDSQILGDVQGQFPYTGRSFVCEPPPSLHQSPPQAMNADFPCDALPCDKERSLSESSKRRLLLLKTTQTFETIETKPLYISTEVLSQLYLYNDINEKLCAEYLFCCHRFQELSYRLENSDKNLGKREHRVPGTTTDECFAQYRRDKDKLLATPNISLDMWSVLCLLESTQDTPDDLLDRLETTDLRFMTAVRGCLRLCKNWIELVKTY
ncbi:hypothetical protein F52700_4471 [Fusarium sp. NRRL 52700]|nr:hypothetical protein F52700_4471 [Fusarium sp. NRRL 52700]